MGQGSTALLEREAEVERLGAALEDAQQGQGGVVLVEAPAGLGKTSLLAEAGEAARERGIAVLGATCGELEQPFPFGVCLQLFAEPVGALDAGENGDRLQGGAALARPLFESGPVAGPQPDEDRMFALLHGLWWLVAELADETPLLLTVDDAQWADEPSLRFLDFLGRRLEGLSVIACVAVRTGEATAEPDPLRPLREGPACTQLRPAALSRGAVGRLVATRAGSGADALARACATVTAGNPYYLRQVLESLRGREAEPAGALAEEISSGGLQSISGNVLGRIARLGDDATKLARAVAILGDRTPLRRACNLAGLDPGGTAPTVDQLAAADVLRHGEDLGFAHPIVRQSVYDGLPAASRAAAHARAARLLGDEGTDPDAIAAQLLRAERLGEPWAVEALRSAARRAAERGAHHAAATYLRRALDEPPGKDKRAGVLHELGTAEMLRGDPGCVERLREAFEASGKLGTDEVARAELRALIAATLTRALVFAARAPEAVAVLRDALDELGDRRSELTSRLHAELLGMALLDPASRDAIRADLERCLGRADELVSDADRPVLGVLALEATLSSRPARDAARLAKRALAGGALLDELPPDNVGVVGAIATLQVTDHRDLTEPLLADAQRVAERSGSVRALGVVTCLRSRGAFRWGVIEEAELHGRSALRLATEHGWPFGIPTAIACVADPLIERGELDEAAEVIAPLDFDGPLAEAQLFQMARDTAARLALAKDDPETALRLALACGEWERAWGTGNSGPTHYPWRATAAVACLALDDVKRARELAGEQLEAARSFGTYRAVGIALRVAGLAERGDRRLEMLGEAAATLARSPAALEHARAQADLGMALRSEGRRREARERLYEAHDGARRCGATVLVELTEGELRAAGARPRRAARSGSDALTPSERRVAELAASGLGNRAIAQRLYLGRRTVETHLTSAYRKLEIAGREQLADALDQPGVNSPVAVIE